MAKIAVDPGHGINTPGKRTPKAVPKYGRVVKEYEFNKGAATYLKKALERHGHTVVWTGGDSDPSLSARVKKANSKNVDLFISVHYNAGGGHGVETYIVGRGGNAEKLANKVQPNLVKVRNQRNRGVKVANFYVIKYTKAPAILVEAGFMDDPRGLEQSWMLDKDFQKGVGEAICKGVQQFYGKSYKAPSGGGSGSKDNPFDQYDPKELPAAPNGAKMTRTLKLTNPMQQGKDVEAVQSHPYVKKYLKGSVDGYFGPDTKQAVMKYQEEHGIKVTGEIGDANWMYLFKKKEEDKKEEKKQEFTRVYVDGKQIASFSKANNVVNKVNEVVKEELAGDGKVEIKIERVYV